MRTGGRRVIFKAVAAGACALILAGCGHVAATPASSSVVDSRPASQERWDQGQADYLVWNAQQRGWAVSPSGLQYKRIRKAPASSPQPTPDATVTIHYTGTFIDGREFDSSRARGEPATFPLNRLIQGWQEGVPMMRVGERWLFAIPADLAYGPGRGPIHPNSALLFDIELIAIPE
jgi:FKBP-type peptidyl-prolyl cis-trans isomerase FkpA